MSMAEGKVWQDELKSFNLELTRGMSAGSGNIVYVGTTFDLDRLQDHIGFDECCAQPSRFDASLAMKPFARYRHKGRLNQNPDFAYEGGDASYQRREIVVRSAPNPYPSEQKDPDENDKRN